jgi:hypothetical protein
MTSPSDPNHDPMDAMAFVLVLVLGLVAWWKS